MTRRHEAEGIDHILGRPEARRALRLAAGHINVSAPSPISEAQLLRVLLDVAPGSITDPHIASFLNESDIATVADLVISGAVTYGQLAKAAAIHLPAEHETRRWLDERAGL